MAGTNSAMIRVIVLIAKVRRDEWLNEQLHQTLDIGNMFGPTLASKITVISC